MIDVSASPISREMESFREQKKSHSDSIKLVLLVDKTDSWQGLVFTQVDYYIEKHNSKKAVFLYKIKIKKKG